MREKKLPSSIEEKAWVNGFPGRRSTRSGQMPELGTAGDAGEARGEQAAALEEREGWGWKKRSTEPFTPTPALFRRRTAKSDNPIVT